MTFAPRTWVVGEVVTAALLNQEIRDQISSMLAAWTSYTPAWTAATTNPVLNNGSIAGLYMKLGRTVQVHAEMTAGSTTTYGSGQWSMSLPAASTTSPGIRIGTAQASGSIRAAGHTTVNNNATTFGIWFPATTAVSNLSACTATVPFTWANTNILRCTLTYEAAA
ncbi:hypothetical protein EAO71_20210 [Streptomyces sp. ms191]|uniref:hypothetical protein n=1 Tax=Streptomyces sp. ms191 TaxID=1827978 RepID=UPI0011CEBE02|nr:hypothetical protein [Streptomyces sp. ms191]TXS30722.1 hypothetical protein EAO71_20210 [Streptomyces sp. ms191]